MNAFPDGLGGQQFAQANFQMQSQLEKAQKMREEVQRQLEQCLKDMLVNLYNSKPHEV